jgi:hypothetical protein
MKIDSLELLKTAWVVEAMLLLIFCCVASAWMPLERLEIFAKLVPVIMGGIGAQGAAAAVGPAVKRNQEIKKAVVNGNKKPCKEKKE